MKSDDLAWRAKESLDLLGDAVLSGETGEIELGFVVRYLALALEFTNISQWKDSPARAKRAARLIKTSHKEQARAELDRLKEKARHGR